MARVPDSTLPDDPFVRLIHRLRDLRRVDEAAEITVEPTAARTQWLASVDLLIRSIRAWMLPVAAEGLAGLDLATVHVDKDSVGSYDAPALKMTFPGSRIVWVRPVGTMQVGAQGIVDVVCASNRALLVLNRAGVWKIRGVAEASRLLPLDGHSFARALGELIE